MAFYGSNFVFNGVSSEEFDLMLYDIGGNEQENGSFASVVTPIEDELVTKWKPVFYGMKFENKLEFTLVFGVNQERIDARQYLDRYELDAIASWLTGHDGYRWLSIVQDDMQQIRYKCYVSNLETVEYGMIPWALSATITCDGPYAYLSPHVYTAYLGSGGNTLVIPNESSHNGYYYPTVKFKRASGDSLIIINNSDGDRIFKLENIPASVTNIQIDNENGIIENNADLNLYDGFNFNFLRLKRGMNELKITGNGTLQIICEFPVNIGG